MERIIGVALLVPVAYLAWVSVAMPADEGVSPAWYDELARDVWLGTTPGRFLAGVAALVLAFTAVDLITGKDWWWRRADRRY